jgi:hypothetical protein
MVTIYWPENRSLNDARSQPPLIERSNRTPLTPTVRDTATPPTNVMNSRRRI